jgi:hypothetical protein
MGIGSFFKGLFGARDPDVEVIKAEPKVIANVPNTKVAKKTASKKPSKVVKNRPKPQAKKVGPKPAPTPPVKELVERAVAPAAQYAEISYKIERIDVPTKTRTAKTRKKSVAKNANAAKVKKKKT